MAWGTKYKIQFEDFFYRNCEINILYENYNGNITILYGTRIPVSWESPSDGRNKLEWIKGQALELDIMNITFEQYTNDFKDYGNKDIACQFIRDGNTIFYGFYLSDDLSEPYLIGPNVLHLTFTDGLGLLKNEPYLNNDGTYYYGERSLMQILYDCLNKTGLLEDFMGSFREACVFYAQEHDSNDEDSPLTQTYVFAEHFLADDGKITCYEVLERILISQASRIEQHMGIWHITPLECFKQEYVSRLYTANGGTYTYVSNTNLDYNLQITGGSVNRNSLNCFFGQTQKREIDKGYKALTVNFYPQQKDAINFVYNFDLFYDNVPLGWYKSNNYTGIEANDENSQYKTMLKWSKNTGGLDDTNSIEIPIINNDDTFGGVKFELEIKMLVDTYWAKNIIQWQLIYIDDGNTFYVKEDGTSSSTYYLNTFVHTSDDPGIIHFYEDTSINVTIERFPASSNVTNFYLRIFAPFLNSIVTYFESASLKAVHVRYVDHIGSTFNINSNNSEIKTVDLKLGDIPDIRNKNLYYFNGLMLSNGEHTTQWMRKGESVTKQLVELLAISLGDLYKRNMWRLEGDMISIDFLPAMRIIDENNKKIYMIVEFKIDVRFDKTFVTLLEIDSMNDYLLKESGESGDSVVFIQTESAEDVIELE